MLHLNFQLTHTDKFPRFSCPHISFTYNKMQEIRLIESRKSHKIEAKQIFCRFSLPVSEQNAEKGKVIYNAEK